MKAAEPNERRRSATTEKVDAMNLSVDLSFNFNLLRLMGTAPYHGADIAEIIDLAGRLTPGDFESWHSEFFALAQRVAQEGWHDRPTSPVTRRDRAFRAAAYYRAADFYLHGNPNDPRIKSTWADATDQFDRAIAELARPGERVTIAADGFGVPAIIYRAGAGAGAGATPRPTVLMFNGFDGSQEEMLHVCGFAALERGFHVVTFEGPGQPTVLREQGLGFRPDWEAAVSPVVDFCETVPEIDVSRLALLGLSFGGYLAPRAAAFEPRIAAAVTIDGLFDGNESVTNLLAPQTRSLLDRRDADAFNTAVRRDMQHDTGFRWYMDQALWAFRVDTPYVFFQRAKLYTLDGVVGQIACPVLVCQATADHFNPGQAERLATALGRRATLRPFSAAESAAAHAHPGASVLMNAVVFDWLDETFRADYTE
jgi:alpha-beta hydrolase superfamily lysophospholipase